MPIVTASDGSPSRVTRKPLSAPHSPPTTMTAGMIASIGQLWFHSDPISALVRPRIEATERSISAATMISVIGSAMSEISATSDRTELRFWPRGSRRR